MNDPLVSVIIPACDRPAWLLRAVSSVMRQTYQHTELIVVNDGREDTVRLRRRLTDAFPDADLRVIRNTRRPGGSGARNMGAEAAKGLYLAFLDDDDEWLPGKLERQVEAMQRGLPRVGVVCCHDLQVARDGRHTVRTRALEGDVSRELCRAHTAGNTSGPLIAGWAFEAVGGFDERLPAAQDTDLWLRLARYAHFATVPEPLVRVYSHDHGRITTNPQRQLIGVTRLIWKHWSAFPAARRHTLLRRVLGLARACVRRAVFG
jgi:glycosyltransferase involved in cell wall biosynthesis